MTPGQATLQLLEQMIWIDYAIVAVMAAGLLIGMLRGIGRELLSLFNWSLASTVGWFFADDFTRLIASSITDRNLQIAAAFTIMFVITLTVSGFVILLMDYERKKNRISIVGHVAGIPAGFLRSLILVNLVVVLAGLTPLPKENWWHESKMIPPFQTSTVWLKHYFPSGFSGYISYR